MSFSWKFVKKNIYKICPFINVCFNILFSRISLDILNQDLLRQSFIVNINFFNCKKHDNKFKTTIKSFVVCFVVLKLQRYKIENWMLFLKYES